MALFNLTNPAVREEKKDRGWFGNLVTDFRRGLDDIWTTPVAGDVSAADAFGYVGGYMGGLLEATGAQSMKGMKQVGEAVGRDMPNQIVNFLPMIVGEAVGKKIPGAQRLGAALSSALTASDVYAKTGDPVNAAVSGALVPVYGPIHKATSQATTNLLGKSLAARGAGWLTGEMASSTVGMIGDVGVDVAQGEQDWNDINWAQQYAAELIGETMFGVAELPGAFRNKTPQKVADERQRAIDRLAKEIAANEPTLNPAQAKLEAMLQWNKENQEVSGLLQRAPLASVVKSFSELPIWFDTPEYADAVRDAVELRKKIVNEIQNNLFLVEGSKAKLGDKPMQESHRFKEIAEGFMDPLTNEGLAAVFMSFLKKERNADEAIKSMAHYYVRRARDISQTNLTDEQLAADSLRERFFESEEVDNKLKLWVAGKKEDGTVDPKAISVSPWKTMLLGSLFGPSYQKSIAGDIQNDELTAVQAKEFERLLSQQSLPDFSKSFDDVEGELAIIEALFNEESQPSTPEELMTVVSRLRSNYNKRTANQDVQTVFDKSEVFRVSDFENKDAAYQAAVQRRAELKVLYPAKDLYSVSGIKEVEDGNAFRIRVQKHLLKRGLTGVNVDNPANVGSDNVVDEFTGLTDEDILYGTKTADVDEESDVYDEMFAQAVDNFEQISAEVDLSQTIVEHFDLHNFDPQDASNRANAGLYLKAMMMVGLEQWLAVNPGKYGYAGISWYDSRYTAMPRKGGSGGPMVIGSGKLSLADYVRLAQNYIEFLWQTKSSAKLSDVFKEVWPVRLTATRKRTLEGQTVQAGWEDTISVHRAHVPVKLITMASDQAKAFARFVNLQNGFTEQDIEAFEQALLKNNHSAVPATYFDWRTINKPISRDKDVNANWTIAGRIHAMLRLTARAQRLRPVHYKKVVNDKPFSDKAWQTPFGEFVRDVMKGNRVVDNIFVANSLLRNVPDLPNWIKEALTILAQHGTKSSVQVGFIPNVIGPDGKVKRYGALYFPGDGFVWSPFDEKGNLMDPQEAIVHFLHDNFHANTVHAYRRDESIQREVEEYMRVVKEKLGEDSRFELALESGEEFLAYAGSDVEFARYLDSISLGGPNEVLSVFDRFVQLVKKAWKFMTGVEADETMLNRVMRINERLMKAQRRGGYFENGAPLESMREYLRQMREKHLAVDDIAPEIAKKLGLESTGEEQIRSRSQRLSQVVRNTTKLMQKMRAGDADAIETAKLWTGESTAKFAFRRLLEKRRDAIQEMVSPIDVVYTPPPKETPKVDVTKIIAEATKERDPFEDAEYRRRIEIYKEEAKKPQFNARQVEHALRWLVEDGYITQEQADEIRTHGVNASAKLRFDLREKGYELHTFFVVLRIAEALGFDMFDGTPVSKWIMKRPLASRIVNKAEKSDSWVRSSKFIGKNLRDALRNIENKDMQNAVRVLLSTNSKALSTPIVSWSEAGVRTESPNRAFYDQDIGIVVPDEYVTEHTLIHEALHAFTTNEIADVEPLVQQNGQFKENWLQELIANPNVSEAVKQVAIVYDVYLRNKDLQELYTTHKEKRAVFGIEAKAEVVGDNVIMTFRPGSDGFRVATMLGLKNINGNELTLSKAELEMLEQKGIAIFRDNAYEFFLDVQTTKPYAQDNPDRTVALGGDYALANLHEFVSVFFADPEFAAKVKELHPSEFVRYAEALNKFLKAENLVEDIMTNSVMLIGHTWTPKTVVQHAWTTPAAEHARVRKSIDTQLQQLLAAQGLSEAESFSAVQEVKRFLTWLVGTDGVDLNELLSDIDNGILNVPNHKDLVPLLRNVLTVMKDGDKARFVTNFVMVYEAVGNVIAKYKKQLRGEKRLLSTADYEKVNELFSELDQLSPEERLQLLNAAADIFLPVKNETILKNASFDTDATANLLGALLSFSFTKKGAKYGFIHDAARLLPESVSGFMFSVARRTRKVFAGMNDFAKANGYNNPDLGKLVDNLVDVARVEDEIQASIEQLASWEMAEPENYPTRMSMPEGEVFDAKGDENLGRAVNGVKGMLGLMHPENEGIGKSFKRMVSKILNLFEDFFVPANQLAASYKEFNTILSELYDVRGSAEKFLRQIEAIAAGDMEKGQVKYIERHRKWIKMFTQSTKMQEAYSALALTQQVAEKQVTELDPVEVDFALSGLTEEERAIVLWIRHVQSRQMLHLRNFMLRSHRTQMVIMVATAIQGYANKLGKGLLQTQESMNIARQIFREIGKAKLKEDPRYLDILPYTIQQHLPSSISDERFAAQLEKMVANLQVNYERVKESMHDPRWYLPERRMGKYGFRYESRNTKEIRTLYATSRARRTELIHKVLNAGHRIVDADVTKPDEAQARNFELESRFYAAARKAEQEMFNALKEILPPDAFQEVEPFLTVETTIADEVASADLTRLAKRQFVEGREFLNMYDTAQTYIIGVTNAYRNKLMRKLMNLRLLGPEFTSPEKDRFRKLATNHLENFLARDTELGKAVSTMNFVYYMAYNLSTMMVEVSQQATALAPVLMENGIKAAQAYKEIFRANKTWINHIMKGSFGSSELDKFMEEALLSGHRDRGILAEFDTTMDEELRFHSITGDTTRLKTKTIKSNIYKLIKFGAHLYGQVTKFNNDVALIAAFQHARNNLRLSYRESKQFAFRVARTSMMGGGKLNRPIGFYHGLQGGIGRTLAMTVMSLQNYSLSMVAMFVRFARKATNGDRFAMKALAGAFGAQLAFAGALGVPFAPMMVALLRQMFDLDLEEETRKMLANWIDEDDELGGFLTTLAMTGPFNSMLKVDVASRLAIGDVFGASRYNGFQLENLAGPTTGIIRNFYDGIKAASQDEPGKAVESFVPVFMKRWVNLARTRGRAEDYKGNLRAELSPYEKLVKVIGFNPVKETQIRDSVRMLNRADAIARDRRAREYRRLAKMLHDNKANAPVVKEMLFKMAQEDPGMSIPAAARRIAEIAVDMSAPIDVRDKATRHTQDTLRGVLATNPGITKGTWSDKQKLQMQAFYARLLGIPGAAAIRQPSSRRAFLSSLAE